MNNKLTPLIARYAKEQTEQSLTDYSYYDDDKDINIEKASGLPLVQSITPLAETVTKTEVKRETDDTTTLTEYLTKTLAQRESDDSSFNHLQELLTMTKVEKESHDANNFCDISDLLTKTKVQRESDDTSWAITDDFTFNK